MREKSKTIEKEYLLDYSGIDAVSFDVQSWLNEIGERKQTVTQMRLVMEDILKSISDHYDHDIKGSLILAKKMGKPVIRFRYEGEAFDPLRSDSTGSDVWVEHMYSAMGISPSWKYREPFNEIRLRDPFYGHKSEIVLISSFILAVIVGLAGEVLPEGFRQFLSILILHPVSAVFLELLGLFAGLFIFMSVLSGICGAGSAGEFGKIGRLMIRRDVTLTFIGTALSVIIARPFFSIPHIKATGDAASQFQKIMDIIIDIIPGDPVTPFAEGNSIQIIFMAIVIGLMMLILNQRVRNVKEIVLQVNELISKGVSYVCKLLPVYVFSSITLQLWEGGVEVLISMYKPLLLCIAMSALFIAVYAVLTGLRVHTSAGKILGKLSPAMMIAFTTASSSAAFSTCFEINENELGISPKLSKLGVPIGSMLCVPAYSQLFILIAFFAAERNAVGGGLSWFIVCWLVTAILSMAVPPVSGGALVCMGVLFTQLGIPTSALALAATLNIFLDFVCTGTKIAMIELELTQQAGILGMIDYDVLRK